MKRKYTLTPRNPLVAAAKFRKAGPHRKRDKAMRREAKIELQREAGRVARHLAFNQAEDGFESLASHHHKSVSMRTSKQGVGA